MAAQQAHCATRVQNENTLLKLMHDVELQGCRSFIAAGMPGLLKLH
jgi:hypothetical protein